MIAIVDYGIGNLRSVEKALQYVGGDAQLTPDPDALRSAAAIVLPGVGAFGDCINQLKARGFEPVIREAVASGVPLVGICVGMQLLFEESEEMGRHQGLGLLPGRVVRFPAGHKVPHIGWNQIHPVRPTPLLEGLAPGSYAYFVHSYYAVPGDEALVLANTDYAGLYYASVVGHGLLFGLQFHPEKSQDVGLRILANLVALATEKEPGA